MLFQTWRSAARAVFGVAAAFWLSPAFAHAVCGDRIFPATLGIDDPGVGDELALPTLTYSPRVPTASQRVRRELQLRQDDLSRLRPVGLSDGPTWLRPGGYGWGDVDTEAKYNFLCVPQWEFMASAGLDVTWAQRARPNMTNPTTPTRRFSTSAWLRRLADEPEHPAAVGGDRRTQRHHSWPSLDRRGAEPETLNWGFTVQYSLPYYNSHIGRDRQRFLKPTFRSPNSPSRNRSPIRAGVERHHRHDPTGLIYMAIPGRSRRGDHSNQQIERKELGAVAELHFFLDDIFPNSLGRPLFQ